MTEVLSVEDGSSSLAVVEVKSHRDCDPKFVAEESSQVDKILEAAIGTVGLVDLEDQRRSRFLSSLQGGPGDIVGPAVGIEGGHGVSLFLCISDHARGIDEFHDSSPVA